MDYALIPDLKIAADQLLALNARFRQQLLREDLPVWVPAETGTGSPISDRECLVRILTPLWYRDLPEVDIDGAPLLVEVSPLPSSGVLCASETSLQMAEQLNDVKVRFRDIVTRIRRSCLDTDQRSQTDDAISGDDTETWLTKSVFSRLVGQALERVTGRDLELASALKLNDITGLNLIWCYRQIRTLPEHTQSVRWTWLLARGEITRVSIDKAIAIAGEIKHPLRRDQVIDALRNLPHQETHLAYRKHQLPQLRANLVIRAPNSDVVERKLVVTSTAVLMPGTALPDCRWLSLDDAWARSTDRNSRATRRSRPTVRIEDRAFIPELGLYRYLPEFRDQRWREQEHETGG